MADICHVDTDPETRGPVEARDPLQAEGIIDVGTPKGVDTDAEQGLGVRVRARVAELKCGER